MSTVFDPIVSEFQTAAQEASYDLWFRAKVEKSLMLADDPGSPRYTTDEVMRRMDKIIKAAEVKNAAPHLAG